MRPRITLGTQHCTGISTGLPKINVQRTIYRPTIYIIHRRVLNIERPSGICMFPWAFLIT